MARKFLVAIDMALNEIKNHLLESIAGSPGSPTTARMWYNSTSGRPMVRGASANLTLLTDVDAPGGDIGGTFGNMQIAAGAIVNADVNAAAAIAYSKLNLVGGIVNADIAAGAAIALSKLATDPLARGNHTGTQTAATISDFNTAVRTNRLDQMAAPTAAVSLNSQKITNLAGGTLSSDAVNLGQLDALVDYINQLVQGLSWKDSVALASTTNITLGDFATDTFDGDTLAEGERVLLKDQTNPAENGIYVADDYPGSGRIYNRADDANTGDELRGATVFVERGSTQAGSAWLMTTDGTLTIDVTGLSWTQFMSAVTYSAGGGIGLSGTTFSVAAGTGLTQDADGLSIDTTAEAERIRDTIGTAIVASGILKNVNDAGDTINLSLDAELPLIVSGGLIELQYGQGLKLQGGTTLAIDVVNGISINGSNQLQLDNAYVEELARDALGSALTAGAGITVTPNDAGNTIAIASTITQYTDEMARDALGTALVGGTGITITPNDAGDTITVASAIVAGGGIGLSGATLSVAAGTGLTQDADGLSIDTTAEAERIRDVIGTALLPDGGNPGITITVNDAGDIIGIGLNQSTVDEFARDALGSALTAGTGITVTPNDGANTISVAVDTAVVARKYAIGNTAGTSTTVTHNLNTRDVDVTVYDATTYEEVEADVAHTTVNTVTVVHSSLSANAIRIVVVG